MTKTDLREMVVSGENSILDGIMSTMRSTVRIDDDLMIELEARAHAESVSLTRILNRTLRAGLA